MLKHGKLRQEFLKCNLEFLLLKINRVHVLFADFTLIFLWKRSGRAGVPMEVMGLMLGEFVDDYTVRVIDVFAMPQSGTVSE